MADLFGLIRLRRHTVEEKQKVLSALYREAENFQNKRRAMEEQILREKALAGEDRDAGIFFGIYAERMRRKIGLIDDAIAKINVRIAAAQEDVRAAFAEQKKAEIIQRKRDEEEESEIAAREDRVLDEIGIEGFRRKDEGN